MCPVGEGNGVDLADVGRRRGGGKSIGGGLRWSSGGTAHVGGHGLVAAETLSGAAALPQGRLKELAAIGRVRSVASLGEVPLEAVAHAGEVSAISCAEAPEVRVVGASVLPLGFRTVEAVRASIGRVRLPLLGSGAAAQTELLQVRFGWACFGRCCVDRATGCAKLSLWLRFSESPSNSAAIKTKKSAQSKRRNESYGCLKKGNRFLHWSQDKPGPDQSPQSA